MEVYSSKNGYKNEKHYYQCTMSGATIWSNPQKKEKRRTTEKSVDSQSVYTVITSKIQFLRCF